MERFVAKGGCKRFGAVQALVEVDGMDLLALASSAKYVITGAVLCVAVTIDALARPQRQLAGRH